ncbi:lipopolysaccharide biosynthesis protein [Pseudoalteromonas ruthenica]|uniref:lipopolysaccharide biosynthesis protein n=1 Tax=Pseudoalteromonas ruthenica TaxID=151081 RepID=UPI0012472E8C|nr:oligosaccharide flippase family protein [Pseudoalteromonas ruthenica]
MLSPFIKRVLTLLSGSVLAQVITLALTPLLARLYSKEAFGELGILMSSSAVLAILFTGKLELSFFNLRSQVQRQRMKLGVVFIALLMGLLFLPIFFIFKSDIANTLNISVVAALLIPVAALFLAYFNLFTNFAISVQDFSSASRAKVARAITQGAAQSAAFFLPLGLIIGEVFGRIYACGYLLYKTKIENIAFSKRKVLATLRKGKPFVKYTTPASLLNTFSMQMPTIFIGINYDAASAGLFLMTQRILAAPTALIGQALSQVYNSEFAHSDLNTAKWRLFRATLVKSSALSLLFFSTLAITAPYLVTTFLGDKWLSVADFILLLTPMFFCQLSIGVISNTLNMLEKNKVMMFWDAFRGSGIILFAIATTTQHFTISTFLLGYSAIMVFNYLVLLALTLTPMKALKDL